LRVNVMTSRRGLGGALIALAASASQALAAPPPQAVQPRPAPAPSAPAEPPPAAPAPVAPERTPPVAETSDPAIAGLTTPIWREPLEPLDLGWHALALPEYIVELAFSPLAFLVGVVEQHRVDRRVIDLLRNDAGTIEVVPDFKFSGGDGFGVGASLELDGLLGAEEEFQFGGLIQLNGDHDLEAEYEQSIISLDGRTVNASVLYELNSDLDYYGLGNDTAQTDQRVLERRGLDAQASLEVFTRGDLDSYGLVQVGYRRTGVGAGNEVGVEPAGEPDDTVVPPPDFGRTTNYGQFALILRHDSRDTAARTQRGILAEVTTRVTSDLETNVDLNALSMRGEVIGFIPILPLYRVLVARFGIQGVLPPTADGQIPLDEYVLLGRKNGLRGFADYRFRDRLGWWSSLEYRYPIYRYEDSPFVLSPAIFADAGRVASNFSDLWGGEVHWNVGVGIAGELETSTIMRIEIGRSREGVEIGFNLGKAL
jgi:Omp85 superfamily domain